MWGRLLYATALVVAGVLVTAVAIGVVLTLALYAKGVGL